MPILPNVPKNMSLYTPNLACIVGMHPIMTYIVGGCLLRDLT